MENRPKDFAAYRGEMARLFGASRVGETAQAVLPVPAARTDERLAQCIWFDSLFLHGNLQTDSGRPLEILQPGRWNEEEGPDFRGAKVRIGGQIVSGDVEIHLSASGWRQHRHHMNPLYDNVILHAYLWREEAPSRPRNTVGKPIEGFAMEPVLFPDLDTIRQTLHVEDYPYQTPSAVGRCQPLMCSLEETFVEGLLDSAGEERLETKTRRFADQAVGETLDQVFYQAMMTAMGHGSNKSLFFLLSKRAPLFEIMDYLHDVGRARAVELFQCILLHVAQLAPENGGEQSSLDAQTQKYLAGVRDIWRDFSGYFSDRLIPTTRQWTTGTRPVNFAHRRLAGVARLLERLFLDEGVASRFSRILKTFDPAAPPRERLRWIRGQLIDAFVVDAPEDFWAHRYTFASRRAARPMKLIGEGRAASIVLNGLLPMLLLHSRETRDSALEESVWQVFRAYPALESNAITRHMRARLFGEDKRGKTLLTTEARQQGLFHIFAACCNQNESGCQDCYYIRPEVRAGGFEGMPA